MRQHPDLGAKVRASGYMVPYSSMKRWREQNPDADQWDAPDNGVKGLKRKAAPFEGVYVGMRVRKIKRWWVTDRGTSDERWHSTDTFLMLWLVAYDHRAKPRYVLPRDVEVTG